VVILSAIIPTLIAQRFFQPEISTMIAWGRLRKIKESKKKNDKK